MGITNEHYEKAAQLLAKHHPSTESHSDTYWQGYLDAVAWRLAGQPMSYESYYRYTPGTVSRDAWAYGWVSGQQFAAQLDQASV